MDEHETQAQQPVTQGTRFSTAHKQESAAPGEPDASSASSAPGVGGSAAPDFAEEPMLYEEPPRLGWRDTLGVVAALAALAVIGVAGYIWLTPGLTFAKFLGLERSAAAPQAEARQAAAHSASAAGEYSNAAASSGDGSMANPTASMDTPDAAASSADETMSATPGMEMPQAPEPAAAEAAAVPPQNTSAADPLAHPEQDADATCPTCGMDSSASSAEVVALWSDGTHTHHDSWDCAFAWGKTQGLTLSRAVVLAHGTTAQEPTWLDATSATYLYGTSRIKMSMPPYMAAFATRAAAVAAQPELGGEVLDFAGLQAQWP